MNYWMLKAAQYDDSRADIISTLTRIRRGLRTLPEKREGRFLMATWNIRELGGTKFGGRSDEALFCIAEMINRFDLVAIQEVRADLRALERIMRILGRDWERIYTDVSYADGGNGERLAFIWDRRKVSFTGLAGELVLPAGKSKKLAQIARTPFICGFQAGWAKFNMCTVHIYYGTAAPSEPRRVEEIEQVSAMLAKKAPDYIRLDEDARSTYSPENLVLLGDFNIFKRSDPTFEALTKNSFVLPEGLMKDGLTGSNVQKDKFYDQIAFYKNARGITNTSAGIFDFYDFVYNASDAARFVKSKAIKAEKEFSNWRTYQLSDHLIMWTEFAVDRSDEYLRNLSGAVTEIDGKDASAAPAKPARLRRKTAATPVRKASAKGAARKKRKSPAGRKRKTAPR